MLAVLISRRPTTGGEAVSTNASTWIGVTGGSTLRFSVKGKKPTDVSFVADARIVPSSGAETQIPDHKLNPGPHKLSVRADTSYVVRLAIKFLGDVTQRAVIAAELADATGKPLANFEGETPYSFEVAGKAGQPIRRCTLVLQRVSTGASP
jgi:hypothetical protein